MRSTSSSSFWRWTLPRRMYISRSWVPIASRICLAESPLFPTMTMRLMAMRRPSAMLNTTLTSPSPKRSTSGVTLASR